MPSITADIQFLADLPLYQHEKPFLCLPTPDQGVHPDLDRLSNLEFQTHKNILVKDIRKYRKELNFDTCGFEVFQHRSCLDNIRSPQEVEKYRFETENLLQDRFGAVKVHTWEVRLRENRHFDRDSFDLNDKMLTEGPALGAHNDVTAVSGPQIIQRYLSLEDQKKYLRPGYRVRIVNTWRPLLPVLEDRPLALCDASSISDTDLIACDRVLPDKVGEVYYLKHRPEHKWYWLEHQKQTEPFIFLMYDTAPGHKSARLCPHVSIENSRKSANASLRRSVETRSIVINKL